MPNLLETLLNNIRLAMKNNGLSQTELASQMNLSKQTVNQLLTGKHSPRLSTIEAASKALKVSGAYLLASDAEKGLLKANAIHKEFIKSQIDQLEGPALEIVRNSIEAVLEELASKQQKALKKSS